MNRFFKKSQKTETVRKVGLVEDCRAMLGTGVATARRGSAGDSENELKTHLTYFTVLDPRRLGYHRNTI